MKKRSCSCQSAFSSIISLLFFLLDMVLDLWAIVSLYLDAKYFAMGLYLFFLVASSVLLQIFSCLWYSDSSPNPGSKLEKFIFKHRLLVLVHILQLGVFLRIIVAVEVSIRSCKQKTPSEEVAKNSTPKLLTLRMFEAFSENAPQLVLMMVLIMQMQEPHPFAVCKTAASLLTMTFSVLSYHRDMRRYISNDLKIRCFSAPTVIYFLWNLFLIGPRVVSVSLFASVLPCYIPAHFLSLWTLLVLWAWWQKTDFMESKAGEWLYRATVALIWYFSWFNVTRGSTKLKGIIYHMVLGVDTMLLLGLWWWRRSVESAQLSPFSINIYLLTVMLIVIIYIVGVALKKFYFWKFRPNKNNLQLDKKQEEAFCTLGSCEGPKSTLSDPDTAERSNPVDETDARETLDPES